MILLVMMICPEKVPSKRWKTFELTKNSVWCTSISAVLDVNTVSNWSWGRYSCSWFRCVSFANNGLIKPRKKSLKPIEQMALYSITLELSQQALMWNSTKCFVQVCSNTACTKWSQSMALDTLWIMLINWVIVDLLALKPCFKNIELIEKIHKMAMDDVLENFTCNICQRNWSIVSWIGF